MTVNFLEGYITRPELAKNLALNERTIYRYERMPDGLPSLMIGGRKRYKLESVRNWIASREKQPNPRRTSQR